MIEIVGLPEGERGIVEVLAVGRRDDLGEHPFPRHAGADGMNAGRRGAGRAAEGAGGEDRTEIDRARWLERHRGPAAGTGRLGPRRPIHGAERVALDDVVGGDMDVRRDPDNRVDRGEPGGIEPDLAADVGRRRLLGKNGAEPRREVAGGEQRGGDDRQRPRRIVGDEA